jgi:hypothetical protein
MSRRGNFKELNLLNTKLFEHLRRPCEEPLALVIGTAKRILSWAQKLPNWNLFLCSFIMMV